MPTYAQAPVQNYFGQAGLLGTNLLDNIGQYRTPTNDLQTQAATNAGLLGSSPLYDQAATIAQGAANAPANTVGSVAGYNANTYDPNTYAPSSYTAANYTAPTLGAAAQAAAPSLSGDSAVKAGSSGYAAAQAQAAKLAALLEGTATTADATSVLDNGGIQKYVSPHLGALVDSSLADYDYGAGIQQAQAAAAGAKNKAFGGSRYALGEAQLASDLTRGRAATSAGLRDNAYRFGAGLAQYDATNRQNTNTFNAGLLTNTSLQNAQMGNTRNQVQGQLTQQANIANAGFKNDASAFGANAKNQASMFNAGQQNNLTAQGAQLAAQNAMFNTGQQNQFALTGAELAAQAGQFNANSANQAGQFNANSANQANQFGAAAANQAGQFGAAAQNDAGQFNSANLNAMNQFNANQQDQQLQNQLAAAGLLGNLGSAQGADARANAGTQMDIGNSLYAQQQNQNLLPFALMQAQQGLLNPGLISAMSGQTINSSGTGTSTESGGLLGQLLGPLAQLGSAAITKSERRVKRDIELLAREPDGLGVFEYNYLWDAPDEPKRRGVMRDEVEQLRPWALGPVVDGVGTVDYSKLGAR